MRSTLSLARVALLMLSAGWTMAANRLEAANNEATHKQARSIAPMVDGRPVKLETFCVGPDNCLWMCCAGASGKPGAVMVYSGEGKLLNTIPLSFLPQAINFSPEGKLFVAGSGKIARLSDKGEIEVVVDTPNIGNREEIAAAMKKQAEAQRKMIEEATKTQVEKMEAQIAKLAEVPEDETEKAKSRRERRLKLLNASLDNLKQSQAQVVESMGNEEFAIGRLASATGVAATDEDVFVSCPKTQGYGYGIWRMNHDLTESKLIVSDVSGCCGQLDIQTDGENLVIAENTKFEVGFYDRDGKRLHGWGKRARNSDDGFGSCCNPMNVRCCPNGEVLTAESSIGHIKRYNQVGEFLGFVGTAKVAGGCKHVAIGFDMEKNWHYMMNEDRSHVAVLVPRDQAPAETEDEKIAREAVASMGKFLYGTWEMQSESVKEADPNDLGSMTNYIQSGFGHMEFSPDGSLVKGAKGMRTKKAANTEGQAAESKSLFGALLSAVAGSSEQADVLLTASDSKWQAIRAHDGKLDLVTIDESVQGFGATIEFTKDDEAKFTFFYGDPDPKSSPYGTFVYKRTSLEACGKDCSGSCEKK